MVKTPSETWQTVVVLFFFLLVPTQAHYSLNTEHKKKIVSIVSLQQWICVHANNLWSCICSFDKIRCHFLNAFLCTFNNAVIDCMLIQSKAMNAHFGLTREFTLTHTNLDIATISCWQTNIFLNMFGASNQPFTHNK